MSKKMSFIKKKTKDNIIEKKQKHNSFLNKEPTVHPKPEKIQYHVTDVYESPTIDEIKSFSVIQKPAPKQISIPESTQKIWEDFKTLSLNDPLRHGGGVGTTNYYSSEAATATLYVSPDGDNSNGSSWSKAYNTLNSALDAASIDDNASTKIYVAPGTYDINTTGDPTYNANVSIFGDTRHDVKITNTHASATSILKFTKRLVLANLTINFGTTSINGITIANSGSRIYNVYFEAENVTGNHKCLILNSGQEYFKSWDVFVHGVQTYTIGIYIDNFSASQIVEWLFLSCKTCVDVVNGSIANIIDKCGFNTCTTCVSIGSGCVGTLIRDYDIVNVDTVFIDNGTSTQFFEPDPINFTQIHYVSKEGDNSNGHTWDTAFTDLDKALTDATSTTTYGLSEIRIAPGTYDLATTNNLYTGSFVLQGLSEHSVNITNSSSTDKVLGINASAFNADKICIIPSGGQNGIEIATSQDGCNLTRFHVDGTSLTTTATLLKLTTGSFASFDRLTIEGNGTNTTGIEIDGLTKARFDDCRIGQHLKAIDIQSGNGNVFIGPIRLNSNITAINIESGVVGTKLVHLELVENTTNLSDNGTDTYLKRKDIDLDIEVALIFPTASDAGIQITTGTAGAWGNYAEIDDGSSFTKAFKITNIAVGNPSAANDFYFVEIAYGSAGSESTLAQTAFSGGKSPVAQLNTGWIPAGTRIAARGQSSSGSDTFDVWIEYVEL